MDRDYLAELVATWSSDFDWRVHERRISSVPNHAVDLGGRPVHFVHVRGEGPDPIPLLITHGWPSSFLEMLDILPRLTRASTDSDGRAVCFDVIVPSIPGYGFSPPPIADGRTPFVVADLWAELMRDVLGYPRFIAHGGDIGARVTVRLARRHPEAVAGIHLTTDWADDRLARASRKPEDRAYVRRLREWEREEGAYGEIQGTKPQTLAMGLNDSPAGLLAWIVEKWRAWSDRRATDRGAVDADTLLATATLYWLTESIGSSFLPYYRYRHTPRDRSSSGLLPTPTGIARMPGDAPGSPSQAVAVQQFNLVHWTDMPRGGHFAAIEVPDLLASDLRKFARRVWR